MKSLQTGPAAAFSATFGKNLPRPSLRTFCKFIIYKKYIGRPAKNNTPQTNISIF
jgi:hypothetical protein